MKQVISRLALIIGIVGLTMFSNTLLAEDPPPPPPPGSHGETGNKGPMGAPVGGGVAIFMAFAAGVAAWEWYRSRKQTREA